VQPFWRLCFWLPSLTCAPEASYARRPSSCRGSSSSLAPAPRALWHCVRPCDRPRHQTRLPRTRPRKGRPARLSFPPIAGFHEEKDELALLITDGRDAHRNNCVAIVELDTNITQPLRDFAANTKQLADKTRFRDRLISASQNLLVELRVQFRCENPLIHGLAIHPKGLPTVTIEPRTNRFIGLHIDSWDGFSLADRGRASNRVSVNVGTTPRYFLFVNQTLTTIADALDRSGAAIQSLTPTEIGRTFMSRFPEYPVVRLQVNPGEAYIAPTEMSYTMAVRRNREEGQNTLHCVAPSI